jgi:hypothetical protein
MSGQLQVPCSDRFFAETRRWRVGRISDSNTGSSRSQGCVHLAIKMLINRNPLRTCYAFLTTIEVNSQQREVVLLFPAGSLVAPSRQLVKKAIDELTR